MRRTVRTPRATASLLAALASAPAAVCAQSTPSPARYALRWQTPPGDASCPDAARVHAMIDALLARRTAAAPTARVAVDAEASALDARTWRVRIVTTSGTASGERALEVESCAAAAETVALVVALAVAPDPPAAPSPPRAAPAPPPARPAARAQPLRVRAAARGFALFDVGTLPAPAVGAGLAGGVEYGVGRFEVLATVVPPQRADVPASTPARVSASFWLAAGGVRGCVVPLQRTIELGACAAWEIGYLAGTGVIGTSSNRTTGTVWSAVTASALVGWRLGDAIALTLEVGPAVTLAGAQFVFETVAPAPVVVYATSPLLLRGQLGAAVRF